MNRMTFFRACSAVAVVIAVFLIIAGIRRRFEKRPVVRPGELWVNVGVLCLAASTLFHPRPSIAWGLLVVAYLCLGLGIWLNRRAAAGERPAS
jgi:hypothetical protein